VTASSVPMPSSDRPLRGNPDCARRYPPRRHVARRHSPPRARRGSGALDAYTWAQLRSERNLPRPVIDAGCLAGSRWRQNLFFQERRDVCCVLLLLLDGLLFLRRVLRQLLALFRRLMGHVLLLGTAGVTASDHYRPECFELHRDCGADDGSPLSKLNLLGLGSGIHAVANTQPRPQVTLLATRDW
jgi:hypothetical protein